MTALALFDNGTRLPDIVEGLCGDVDSNIAAIRRYYSLVSSSRLGEGVGCTRQIHVQYPLDDSRKASREILEDSFGRTVEPSSAEIKECGGDNAGESVRKCQSLRLFSWARIWHQQSRSRVGPPESAFGPVTPHSNQTA